MVPLRNAVHVSGEFFKVHPLGENGSMETIAAAIEPAAGQMLDELAWWAWVTRQGRLDEAATQAAS